MLGAAKTGSGKTLAFLVPVLELLHRLRWGSMDGLTLTLTLDGPGAELEWSIVRPGGLKQVTAP